MAKTRDGADDRILDTTVGGVSSDRGEKPAILSTAARARSSATKTPMARIILIIGIRST
jgi:hypothetical protein